MAPTCGDSKTFASGVRSPWALALAASLLPYQWLNQSKRTTHSVLMLCLQLQVIPVNQPSGDEREEGRRKKENRLTRLADIQSFIQPGLNGGVQAARLAAGIPAV